MSVDPFLKGYDKEALLDLVNRGAKELTSRGVPVHVLQGEAAKLAISQSAELVEGSAAAPHHETQIIPDETGLYDPR